MGEGGWHFPAPEDNLPGANAIPDPLYKAKFLSELYFKVNPDYKGRYTVPILWDRKTEVIVNNESSEIIRMLYTEFDDLVDEQYKGLEFLKGRKGEIEDMNQWIYDGINNGVYKSGFATFVTTPNSFLPSALPSTKPSFLYKCPRSLRQSCHKPL